MPALWCITPFLGHFPWEGPCPSLFCCLGCRWGGCPGAALVPSCTTRTGLDIPQPFLFPFRDLITEESLNLLIVIRTCVFGSFPYSLTSFAVSAKPPLPSHSWMLCKAGPEAACPNSGRWTQGFLPTDIVNSTKLFALFGLCL